MILSFRGHLTTSGDISGYHSVGEGITTGIQWVQVRKCCLIAYTAQDSLHRRELSSPKCQWRKGWKTLDKRTARV